jgi:hypothetical protein
MACPRHTLLRSVIVAAVALLMLWRAPSALAQQTSSGEAVDLVNGCTNVSLTWPAGTPVASVAAAVSPSGSVQAIWKLDAPSQRFLAWSPVAVQASDLTTVNPLDAVYICTDAVAVLVRPPLSVSSPSPSVVITAPPAAFASNLSIISVTDSIWRGGTAFITVQAPVGASCDIDFRTPLGVPPSTTGLGPRKVDQTGTVTWIWTVPAFTPVGTATVTVFCGGFSVTAIITIV